MTSTRGRCLVIGLGKRFRSDDGVGLEVVSELRRRRLPDWIQVVDGGADEIGLIDYLGDAGHVVLVDATSTGRAPGVVRAFSVGGAGVLPAPRNLSLHAFGLQEAVGVARSLGASAAMTIVGIEPESTAPGGQLSETVRLRVPELVEAVLHACDAACAGSEGGGPHAPPARSQRCRSG